MATNSSFNDELMVLLRWGQASDAVSHANGFIANGYEFFAWNAIYSICFQPFGQFPIRTYRYRSYIFAFKVVCSFHYPIIRVSVIGKNYIHGRTKPVFNRSIAAIHNNPKG